MITVSLDTEGRPVRTVTLTTTEIARWRELQGEIVGAIENGSDDDTRTVEQDTRILLRADRMIDELLADKSTAPT